MDHYYDLLNFVKNNSLPVGVDIVNSTQILPISYQTKETIARREA